MAEVATPSGVAIFDASSSDKKKFEKPEKPDEAVYKTQLDKAQKDLSSVLDKLNKVRGQLDLAKPASKDSPSAKARTDLQNQLKEIREQQGAGKAGRGQILDRIRKLDESMKTEMNNLKASRSKLAYKGVDDVDRQINELDKQVNSGLMKLVDEKKALAEISGLRKQRKNFAGFDDIEKSVQTKKAEIKKLRDTLDDPESKALSDKYNSLQSKLNEIKAEQDEAYKNLSSLRDERTKLQAEQQEKYAAVKKIKDDFYNQNRAVQKYEYEARQHIRERKKKEQETFAKEKKKERAQQVLEEASEKAYLDEIRRGESLLRFFDPSFVQEKAPLQAPSGLTATAQRAVDDSGLKGTKLVRKEEEDYFSGTAKKPKGKKNKKNAGTAESPATPTATKFSCPPAVMEDCTAMGIDPPMSAAGVPSVLEKVKEKLKFWKEDQEAQTEKNIAKAKKELDRLEAEEEASPATSDTPPTTNGNHGETKATAGVADGGSITNEVELIKNAVADVAADLKDAFIEDKE